VIPKEFTVDSRKFTVNAFSKSARDYELWTVNCVPTVDCELFADIPRCCIAAWRSVAAGLSPRSCRHLIARKLH
jgi:hypothetical protein